MFVNVRFAVFIGQIPSLLREHITLGHFHTCEPSIIMLNLAIRLSCKPLIILIQLEIGPKQRFRLSTWDPHVKYGNVFTRIPSRCAEVLCVQFENHYNGKCKL